MYHKLRDQLDIKSFQNKKTRICTSRNISEYRTAIWASCWCDMYYCKKSKYLALALVFQFLEKIFFNIMFETVKRVFDNFQHVGKLFQTVGAKQNSAFCPEHVLLDGRFSRKTIDLVFTWSLPEGLYKSFKPREQFTLKDLKTSEQMYSENKQMNLLEIRRTFICLNSLFQRYLCYLVEDKT